jgi:hypothetical protein
MASVPATLLSSSDPFQSKSERKWPKFRPSRKIHRQKYSLSNLSTKDRDSHVMCCFTQGKSSGGAIASGKSAQQSGSPANKSASLPRNFEAGSNVIDASEPQLEKQRSPMTVTEAGR